ncbi:ribonuclease P protein subunit p21 isoform X1 [Lathamus discolor]|uniref:ribonuclease P protein subunit p21 isoform X1 n=1 Tax=Lathamus discolor TaxID=678569 RepID=UPI0032B72F34
MAAAVKDREVLQRLSFLFQAAHWVLPHSPALARFYCSIQRGTARRLVLRLAPSVKRGRVPPLLLAAAARRWGLPAPARPGAAPHGSALPELRPPPALPLRGATPPGAGHAPRRPARKPTWQQSGAVSTDWSLQPPLTNQKTPVAEINLPLFHIWYQLHNTGRA